MFDLTLLIEFYFLVKSILLDLTPSVDQILTSTHNCILQIRTFKIQNKNESFRYQIQTDYQSKANCYAGVKNHEELIWCCA